MQTSPLSRRELQIIHLLREGLSHPEIGKRLGISWRTVTVHKQSVFHKLNIHSTAALIDRMYRDGVFSGGDA